MNDTNGKKPTQEKSKEQRRDEKWERLADRSDAYNRPVRDESNLFRMEVDDMIEDEIPDLRILIQVVIQLMREQARTANALEDIRELVEVWLDR